MNENDEKKLSALMVPDVHVRDTLPFSVSSTQLINQLEPGIRSYIKAVLDHIQTISKVCAAEVMIMDSLSVKSIDDEQTAIVVLGNVGQEVKHEDAYRMNSTNI